MNLKILIVDDDLIILKLISDHFKLQMSQHEIFTATNGQEAFALIKEHQPELVLTDINMPVMNGLELIKNIRIFYPETIVVVLSAVFEPQIIFDALKNGARDYVLKPDFKSFFRIVDKAIRYIKSNIYIKDAVSNMSERLEFEISNDVRLIGGVVRKISGSLKERGLNYFITDVTTALDEALVNALFYGNLGFTREEIDNYSTTDLRLVVAERLRDDKYKNRKIKVLAEITPKFLRFKITDEGDGYKWQPLTDKENLYSMAEESGHGLLMINLYMSNVEFNEKGNEITMTLEL